MPNFARALRFRVAGALVSVVSAGAMLAPCHADAQPARIEPGVARALATTRPGGGAPGTADVLIELRGDDDLAGLVALEGVELARGRSGPIVYHRFAQARVDARGLAALATARFALRVRLAPPTGILPLDRSAEHLGVPYARGLVRDGLTGRGTLIADLDSPVDPFHPALFHADAGYFEWIDRDGDGRFGAGDGIDTNHDGALGPTERASVLSASPMDFGGTPTSVLRRSGFDPGIDWLYLDLDGNGVRDVGASAGYGDSAPGMGEPIFVPDDVDRDGVLDLAERVVQLGTSKIRAYRVDLGEGGGVTYTYERGEDLSDALRDYTGGAYGYADTLHATGVAGILVADVPLIGRRWVGIAPEAEVVFASDIGATNLDGLMWALGANPDVVLHEYVLWTGIALDGSDPTSALIDLSTDEGVAHACPAGNIGGAGRHAMTTLAPSSTTTFEANVLTAYLELTVHVPVGTAPVLTLVEPSGTRHAFTGTDAVSDGTPLYRAEADGVRTFRALTFSAYRTDGTPLPSGNWSLEVASGPGASFPVHAFVYDEYGFSGGSTLAGATDVSTLAWPSTADRCLAVGAYPSHTSEDGVWFSGAELDGEVRGYSARGPRLDGLRTIAVVAPDNPWSSLGAGDAYPASPGFLIAPEGAYQIFSGTSGAGPHVAGTLALLAQLGVRGAAATSRIVERASRDALTGPSLNDDYGSGRLDAAAALGAARRGSPPRVSLSLSADGSLLRIAPAASDPDGSTVTVRWDLDYDGEWDTPLAALAPRSVLVPARIKVEVVDEDGRRDQAVVRIDSLDELGARDAGVVDAGVFPRDGEARMDTGVAPRGVRFEGCACATAGHTRLPPMRGGALVLLGVLLAVRAVRARRAHAPHVPSGAAHARSSEASSPSPRGRSSFSARFFSPRARRSRSFTRDAV